MATRIQHLRGTAAEWLADDIVVPQGEIAIEVDGSNTFTGVLKIGNGTDAYSVLTSYSFGGGGGSIKFESWTFDDSVVDSDPGSGLVRFNNVDPTLVTELYISDENSQGVDLSELLEELEIDSNVGVQQVSNIAKAYLYNVTGVVTNGGGYKKIPVTYLSQSGGGVFGNGEILAFSLFRASAAVTGQDEPERIDFDSNLDTIYETSYIAPIQIADITSPGISAISYSAAPDDGLYDFANNVENDNIAALNLYLDGLVDGTWVVVETTVVNSRASSIRRVKNLS